MYYLLSFRLVSHKVAGKCSILLYLARNLTIRSLATITLEMTYSKQLTPAYHRQTRDHKRSILRDDKSAEL